MYFFFILELSPPPFSLSIFTVSQPSYAHLPFFQFFPCISVVAYSRIHCFMFYSTFELYPWAWARILMQIKEFIRFLTKVDVISPASLSLSVCLILKPIIYYTWVNTQHDKDFIKPSGKHNKRHADKVGGYDFLVVLQKLILTWNDTYDMMKVKCKVKQRIKNEHAFYSS